MKKKLNKIISNKDLGEIFQMHLKTVAKNIKNGPQDLYPPGRHDALSNDVEEKIIEEILKRENEGHAMRERDILDFVKLNFHLDLIRGWLNCFFVCHIEELEKCHSTPQEGKRMSIPREFLKQNLN